jgi:plastocyanin
VTTSASAIGPPYEASPASPGGTVAVVPPTASRRARLAAPALALLLAAAACGGDDASTSATTAPTGDHVTSTSGGEGCKVVDDRTVTIVAKDLAWDTACIQAPEGVRFTVEVDNRDSGVQHDFHLKGVPGDPQTDLAPGPTTQHLRLDPIVAGTYEYVCDIHPNMTGHLQVLAPLPEGPTTTTAAPTP